MHTDFMIFVTIGKLASPSSSVNGDPLHDFPDHLVTSFLYRAPSSPDKCGGGLGPPPPSEKTYRLQAGTAAAILWKVELETS
jgi:hypothetical protein